MLVDYMSINMLHQLIINSINALNALFETHSKYLPPQDQLEDTEVDTLLETGRNSDDPLVTLAKYWKPLNWWSFFSPVATLCGERDAGAWGGEVGPSVRRGQVHFWAGHRAVGAKLPRSEVFRGWSVLFSFHHVSDPKPRKFEDICGFQAGY